MIAGRTVTGSATMYAKQALYCYAFNCLPSQLRGEDPDDLELLAHGIMEIQKKFNPFGSGE